MRRVTEHLYTFDSLWAGRAYLSVDADGLTLFDAGTGPAAGRILQQIQQAGYALSDVKRILITHAHSDHAGGLHVVQKATGASVMAGAREAEAITGQSPVATPPRDSLPGWFRPFAPPPTRYNLPTPVERILSEGDVLPEVLGGIHVLHTPGHAIDHLAFWQPEQRILIVGDVLFNLPPRLTLPFAFFTVDMAQNRQSLARIITLQPAVICFGHGKPLYAPQAGEKLKAFAARIGLTL